MPVAAFKLCGHPGCPTLVRGGRCEAHQRQAWKAQDAARESSSARGYDRTWRRLRSQVLTSEPLCRHCLAQGHVTPACEVDHIVPMAHGGARLDPVNLQPLCRTCHSRKTMRESVRPSVTLPGEGGLSSL